ncbi:hypothetical protein ABZN20_11420 [Methylococcus sp. ANG]|uniref:hypothetical protein n=1 Tax=Methylococcus sp. ANG TaxID=3231903 RepID=UPI003459A8D4
MLATSSRRKSAGLAIGGIAGTLAGRVAPALPTGMIGLDVEHSRLKNYQGAVEKGGLLLMVDVPRDRVEEIHQRVQKHHPEAEFEGAEPTIPAFP